MINLLSILQNFYTGLSFCAIQILGLMTVFLVNFPKSQTSKLNISKMKSLMENLKDRFKVHVNFMVLGLILLEKYQKISNFYFFTQNASRGKVNIVLSKRVLQYSNNS